MKGTDLQTVYGAASNHLLTDETFYLVEGTVTDDVNMGVDAGMEGGPLNGTCCSSLAWRGNAMPSPFYDGWKATISSVNRPRHFDIVSILN